MSVLLTDIHVRYSIPTGVAGNSLPQLVPDNSFGKWVSQTDWLGTTIHDLFSFQTAAQNNGALSDYRCVFVYNASGTDTLHQVEVWLSGQTPNGALVAIGADPTAASAVNAGTAQAVTVANANTAPAGVAFTSPVTSDVAVNLGDIPAGHCKALWVRRTGANVPALANDTIVLTFASFTF